MDAVFINNSFLDEMPVFSSEEHLSLEDSEEEDDNVDGFLSTDDEEDLPDIPIYIKNTRSKKEKLDTNLIFRVASERYPSFSNAFLRAFCRSSAACLRSH